MIAQAISGIEKELDNVPEQGLPTAHYNLANGYLAVGNREQGIGPATRPSISRAVHHLDEVLVRQPYPPAHVNLGNALATHGRFVEALDEYNRALALDPLKHEALGNRAIVLIEINRWMLPHHGLLETAYADTQSAIEISVDDAVFHAKWRGVLETLKGHARGREPHRARPSRAVNWIWQNGLNLNLCEYCRIETPDAFDTYALSNVLASPRRKPSIAEVYDMVNSLHRSYATARWLLMSGTGVVGRPPRDHVVVIDGAANAHHDLRIGLVLEAASGFYGVLNQVAACINAYFHLGHDPRWIDLASVWGPAKTKSHRRMQIPMTRKGLHPRFRNRPSRMLSALYRLALSLEKAGGRYWPLRRLRNDIQHHAVVVLDESTTSSYYETVGLESLRGDAIRLGKIAKAALLYFGAAVWKAEHERVKNAQRRGILVVPSSTGHVSRC